MKKEKELIKHLRKVAKGMLATAIVTSSLWSSSIVLAAQVSYSHQDVKELSENETTKVSLGTSNDTKEGQQTTLSSVATVTNINPTVRSAITNVESVETTTEEPTYSIKTVDVDMTEGPDIYYERMKKEINEEHPAGEKGSLKEIDPDTGANIIWDDTIFVKLQTLPYGDYKVSTRKVRYWDASDGTPILSFRYSQVVFIGFGPKKVQIGIPTTSPQATPEDALSTRYINEDGEEVKEPIFGEYADAPQYIKNDKGIITYLFKETLPDEGYIRTHVYTKVVSDIPNEAPIEEPVVAKSTRFLDKETMEEVAETDFSGFVDKLENIKDSNGKIIYQYDSQLPDTEDVRTYLYKKVVPEQPTPVVSEQPIPTVLPYTGATSQGLLTFGLTIPIMGAAVYLMFENKKVSKRL